ncbi:MAG: oligosaccharide flippase family protein [Lachnospiraceae bacterium]|nr:oligosaccharide flippase family protein [Lachnospiraceae bacterium]
MKITVKRKDAVWNLIGTILAMGANLMILPFILIYLTEDDIAIYYIFTSLAGIAALIDFGFSPSVARSMAYAFSGVDEIRAVGAGEKRTEEPNFVLMKQLIKTCKIIYLMLSLAALVISILAGSAYILYLSKTAHGYRYLIPWLIYAFSIFLNILFGYYSVFLRGVGAVADVNIATICSRAVQILLSVVSLILGFGLYGIALAYLLYGFLFRIIAKHKFFSYKGIRAGIQNVQEKIQWIEVKELLQNLWPNTWRDGLVTMANYLVGQATTIIASLCLSLTDTGILSLCVQLATAIATVSMILLTVYQPALQSAFAERNEKAQRYYLSTIVTSYILLFFAMTAGLVLVGVPVIRILKPSYILDLKLLLLVCLYFFILYLRNSYCSYISTTNRLFYSRSFVIAAVLCVIFSSLFAGYFRMGAYGIVWGQILSQVVFGAWYWPWFVHKELCLKEGEMWRQGLTGIWNLARGKQM